MLPMQGPLFFSEGWGGRGLGGLVGGSDAGGRSAELPWPKYPISMICSLVILFSKDENHGNSDWELKASANSIHFVWKTSDRCLNSCKYLCQNEPRCVIFGSKKVMRSGMTLLQLCNPMIWDTIFQIFWISLQTGGYWNKMERREEEGSFPIRKMWRFESR